MGVTAPPIKKRFVPFQIDAATGKYDPETINRNFRKITDGFGILAQKIQTNYVGLSAPGEPSAGMCQSFNDQDLWEYSDGAEHVSSQFIFDGADFPLGILTASFSALVAATSPASVRLALYVGGAFVAQSAAPGGGAQLATVSTPSTSLVSKKVKGTFLNTGKTVPIQISIKGSSAVLVQIQSTAGKVYQS